MTADNREPSVNDNDSYGGGGGGDNSSNGHEETDEDGDRYVRRLSQAASNISLARRALRARLEDVADLDDDDDEANRGSDTRCCRRGDGLAAVKVVDPFRLLERIEALERGVVRLHRRCSAVRGERKKATDVAVANIARNQMLLDLVRIVSMLRLPSAKGYPPNESNGTSCSPGPTNCSFPSLVMLACSYAQQILQRAATAAGVTTSSAEEDAAKASALMRQLRERHRLFQQQRL